MKWPAVVLACVVLLSCTLVLALWGPTREGNTMGIGGIGNPLLVVKRTFTTDCTSAMAALVDEMKWMANGTQKVKSVIESQAKQITTLAAELASVRETLANVLNKINSTQITSEQMNALGLNQRECVSRGYLCTSMLVEYGDQQRFLMHCQQRANQIWRRKSEVDMDLDRFERAFNEAIPFAQRIKVNHTNTDALRQEIERESSYSDEERDWLWLLYLLAKVYPEYKRSDIEKWKKTQKALETDLSQALAKLEDGHEQLKRLELDYLKKCGEPGKAEVPNVLRPVLTAVVSPRGTLSDEERMESVADFRPLASRHVWDMDPFLYSYRVNVSFILQYFRKPGTIQDTVERLYKCTNGRKGGGIVPGLTSELIVNIDEPDEQDLWFQFWKQTDDFMTPIFSHNIHEERGYNRAAGWATGDILIMIQDDTVPQSTCNWLRDMVEVFNSWPRVACIGINWGVFNWASQSPPQYNRRDAANIEHFVYRDNRTGIVMQFVGQVDIGPMAFDARAFRAIGGFNQALSKPGESGIFLDFEITTRLWLAGYQVVHMYTEDGFVEVEKGGTHDPFAMGGVFRARNELINEGYFREKFQSHFETIFDRVKSANSKLERLGTWRIEDGV